MKILKYIYISHSHTQIYISVYIMYRYVVLV